MTITDPLPDLPPDDTGIVARLRAHDTQQLLLAAADAIEARNDIIVRLRTMIAGDPPTNDYAICLRRITRLEGLLTAYDPNWRLRQ